MKKSNISGTIRDKKNIYGMECSINLHILKYFRKYRVFSNWSLEQTDFFKWIILNFILYMNSPFPLFNNFSLLMHKKARNFESSNFSYNLFSISVILALHLLGWLRLLTPVIVNLNNYHRVCGCQWHLFGTHLHELFSTVFFKTSSSRAQSLPELQQSISTR